MPLTKRIIPCLDVTEGRVVKGTQFINLKDAGDAVELGVFYDEQGADELVFLDITASSDKRKILINLVERTGEEVFIPFTVGGGLRTALDMYKDNIKVIFTGSSRDGLRKMFSQADTPPQFQYK